VGFHNRIDLMILPTTDRVPSGKQITAGAISLWQVAPASRRLHGRHLARCFGAAKHAAKMPALFHQRPTRTPGCPIL